VAPRVPTAFGVELRPPFFEPGRWVAPLNYATAVREHWIVPDRVEIHDVTLRDGEQTARIVFTPDEKGRLPDGRGERQGLVVAEAMMALNSST
jgi:hypothetical protein